MRYWIFIFALLDVAWASSPGLSLLSRKGNTLYWDGNPVQLVGYSAFDAITRNNYDYRRYMNALQFVDSPASSQRHGVNLTRIWAMGWHNAPRDCRSPAEADPSMQATRMPFETNGSNCSPKVRFPKYDVSKLDAGYLSRLKEVVRTARNNGIVVELTLFDHYHLLKSVPNTNGPLYAKNPWNPFNNNLYDPIFENGAGCKILPRSRNQSATDVDGLPEFYDICNNKATTASCNASLNCLGKIQKKYVEEIVNTAKQTAGGSDSVFFEVMNEANGAPTEVLTIWHDVVASWIKSASNGEYLVSASTSCNYADIQACRNGTCPNNCQVFQMPNIDIVTLHASAWVRDGVCATASAALDQFGKPVILDTDGNAAIPDRNNKCTVQHWAEAATSCRAPGQVHFNHLDGMTFRNIRRPCSWNPAKDNRNFHETVLDCHTLDAIGDAQPTRLNQIITTDPPRSCPHFSGANWCSDPCN